MVAKIIRFPGRLPEAGKVRCDDCVFAGSTPGATVWCGAYAEEIVDESAAEDCPDFEAI